MLGKITFVKKETSSCSKLLMQYFPLSVGRQPQFHTMPQLPIPKLSSAKMGSMAPETNSFPCSFSCCFNPPSCPGHLAGGLQVLSLAWTPSGPIGSFDALFPVPALTQHLKSAENTHNFMCNYRLIPHKSTLSP